MSRRPVSASSRNEEEMMSAARRKLATETDPLERLRLLCLARGSSGILGLGKVFRRMDDDKSNSLNLEEFTEGITDTGLDLNADDTEKLFNGFDKDGEGSVDFNEFIRAIRPAMNEKRMKLVEMAYDKMDRTDDGIVNLADLRGVYSVRQHPKYLSGELDEDQILKMYIAKFEGSTSTDGKITREEFYDYYSGVSASIDHDAYFDLMMRNAWGIK
ncbi:unnamed protein product [Meganyctiphanes norvegica]|uniref:EF-hand domain-containing protein n=1 Tax=Meganyctiphanes norvegica TaxID=48144 RepID=A0AAV2RAN6_MEGNR